MAEHVAQRLVKAPGMTSVVIVLTLSKAHRKRLEQMTEQAQGTLPGLLFDDIVSAMVTAELNSQEQKENAVVVGGS